MLRTKQLATKQKGRYERSGKSLSTVFCHSSLKFATGEGGLPAGRKCVKPILMGFHCCINRKIRSLNWILAFRSRSGRFLKGWNQWGTPRHLHLHLTAEADMALHMGRSKSYWNRMVTALKSEPSSLTWRAKRQVMKLRTALNALNRASWGFHMGNYEVTAFRDVRAIGGNPLPLPDKRAGPI